jgi:hypothetical protein
MKLLQYEFHPREIIARQPAAAAPENATGSGSPQYALAIGSLLSTPRGGWFMHAAGTPLSAHAERRNSRATILLG